MIWRGRISSSSQNQPQETHFGDTFDAVIAMEDDDCVVQDVEGLQVVQKGPEGLIGDDDAQCSACSIDACSNGATGLCQPPSGTHHHHISSPRSKWCRLRAHLGCRLQRSPLG